VKPFRKGSQRFRILSAFYAGRRLNRFQAEILGAHCLNSLVADLEGLGLKFDRRTVSVPTRWDGDAHITEYWLGAQSFDLAARYLGVDRPRPPDSPASAALLYAKASRG
jgi:hypothetical protein